MTLSTELVVFISVTVLLLLFAVLSNGLVIYCVFKIRNLRTVTNILICNLAVSDILLAGFVLPQKLHDISHEKHFYEGVILCKLVNFTPVFIITCSIYTLVCISLERQRAITESQVGQLTTPMLFKVIPSLWIFSAIVGIPTLLEYDVSKVTRDYVNVTANRTYDLYCGSESMPALFSITNAIFLTLISYLIPVILMLKNYLHLALFIWDTGKLLATVVDDDSIVMRRVQSRIRVVKLMIAVAVIFALSWLPYFVMLPYAKITGLDASYDASGFVNLFLIALATFSTAYNVVLYVILNPSFSCAIKKLFLPRKCLTGDESGHSSIHRDSLGIQNGAFYPDGVGVQNGHFYPGQNGAFYPDQNGVLNQEVELTVTHL